MRYKLGLVISFSVALLLLGSAPFGSAEAATSRSPAKPEKDCPGLGLRLTGVVLAGESLSFAILEDEATGMEDRYGLQDSVKGATVLDIYDESVVLEMERQKCVLKLVRGTSTGDAPRLAKAETLPGAMSRGPRSVHTVTRETEEHLYRDENAQEALRRHRGKVSRLPEPYSAELTAPTPGGDWAFPQFAAVGEPPPSPVLTAELPYFEPVEMAPPSVPVQELPYFEPVEMAPPEAAQPTLPLPEFTPIVMPNGPE